MESWVKQFADDLEKEFGDGPRVGVLATVRVMVTETKPAARCVVIRDVEDDGAVLFISDARSRKNGQLRENHHASIVVWMSELRVQYRLDGVSKVLPMDDDRRLDLWTELSDASRAMFFWPAPLSPKEADEKFTAKVPAETSMPDSFEVFELVAGQVDYLNLNSLPHRRVIWQSGDGKWQSSEVNP